MSLLVFSTFNIHFVCVVQRFFVSVQLVESWAQFVFQHDQRQIDLQLNGVFSDFSLVRKRFTENVLTRVDLCWNILTSVGFFTFLRRSVWKRASGRYKSLHSQGDFCIFWWREILFWFRRSRKGQRGQRFGSSSVQQNLGPFYRRLSSQLSPSMSTLRSGMFFFPSRPHFLVRRWRNVHHTHTLSHRRCRGVSPGSAGGARGRRALGRVGL